MKEAKEIIINVLSILSLGFAFVSPIAGIVLGVISLVQIKGEKKADYKFANKLAIAAIIIAALIFLIQIASLTYTMITTGGSLFPTY
jgi:hypothetical protein